MEQNTNSVKQLKVLGFKTDLYQYVSIVLPAVDVFIITLGAFTSQDLWISVPLNIAFPILGVSSVKIAEKVNSKIPVYIILMLLAFIGGALCYYAGPSSPAWLQAIPLITAILFLIDSKSVQILYIVITIILVTTANFLIGQNLANIGSIVLTLAVISAILERSFQYLLNQQTRIEEQKKIIEEKQKEILDSIHYAKRIQTSLLPTEKNINKDIERLIKN